MSASTTNHTVYARFVEFYPAQSRLHSQLFLSQWPFSCLPSHISSRLRVRTHLRAQSDCVRRRQGRSSRTIRCQFARIMGFLKLPRIEVGVSFPSNLNSAANSDLPVVVGSDDVIKVTRCVLTSLVPYLTFKNKKECTRSGLE